LEGRVETPTGFENMEDQILRKKILTTHQTMSGPGAAEKDIAAVATVLVSSEDPRKLLDRQRVATPADARLVVFDFIEGWYNPRRRYSALELLVAHRV
jgi:hypothetical protein